MTNVPETKSSLTAWERWELASFDNTSEVAAAIEVKPPAVTINEEELARLREAARKEGQAAGQEAGYATGHAEGLAAGQEAAAAKGCEEAEKLARVVAALEARIAELNATVADELVALSIEIARQVVRETIAVRPEVLLGVIREALGQMPLQHASIHLNPEDASLARSRAGDQLAHAGHRIHEDPKLTRGDVVIEVGGTHLDASLATRWRRTIASLGHDAPWVDAPEP